MGVRHQAVGKDFVHTFPGEGGVWADFDLSQNFSGRPESFVQVLFDTEVRGAAHKQEYSPYNNHSCTLGSTYYEDERFNGSTYDTLLPHANLAIDVSGPRDPVTAGEPFEVRARLTNNSRELITDLALVGTGIYEIGGLSVVDGPTWEPTTTLAPGQSVPVSWRVKAANDGPQLALVQANATSYGQQRFYTGRTELGVPDDSGPLTGDFFRTDLLGEYVREGDTVPVRLRVDNKTGLDLTDVRLVDTELVADEPAEATLTPVDTSLRGTLDATGIDSVDFADFTLTGTTRGDVTLVATVEGTNPDGELEQGTVETPFVVQESPLAITLTPDMRREDGSLRELNADNNGDGVIDLVDHQLDVQVEIANRTDDTLTDLHFLDEAEPVDFSNNLTGEDQLVPKVKLLGVRGDPLVLADGTVVLGAVKPLDVTVPDLAPQNEQGASHTVTFVYEATGEVNADGLAVVTGVAGGDRRARGSGTTTVKFGSGTLLEFGAKLTDPFRLTTSGQVVRLDGYLENLDEDKKDASGKVTEKGRSFAVWITPMADGNAGGGFLVEREGGRTPLGAEFITVAPGQRVDLHGILSTRARAERTDADVMYRISAWNLPENEGDQANPVAQERIDLVSDPDAGWSPEQHQRLLPADLRTQKFEECETDFYGVLATCEAAVGFGNALASVPDMLHMISDGFDQADVAIYATTAWSLRTLADTANAILQDPAAQRRLAVELEVQLATWSELAILSTQTQDAILDQVGKTLQETVRVVGEGDVKAGLAYVSRFVGENPDVGIGAIIKARTLVALGQSALRSEVRSAAATVVRDAVTTERALASERLATEIDLAVAQGLDPKSPSVLKGGLDVTDTPKVWRDVYGAARGDVENLLRIAREEGVLIAFRSRSPISIKLLEDGLAWLKPQSVKAKNISPIDVKYLGFPENRLGKVSLIQPPISPNLVGEELEAALEAYVNNLKRTHPELLDPVLAKEVKDRLKMRTTTFNKHLAEWIGFAENGMPVGFDYQANGVSSARDVTGLRDVRLEVSQVPDPLGGPPKTKIDIKVAGPDGKDFRDLTGDIDIVGFFNPDRSPIMDAAKREILYEKMRSLVGMQHGETLTWDHQKRAELLLEHVGPDAETLLVAAPDSKLYTSALDVQKSSEVAPGGNFADTFSLLNGPPIELKSPVRPVGPKPTGRLTSIADDPRNAVQRFEDYLLPANIVKVLTKDGQPVQTTGSQSKAGTPLVVKPDGSIEVYVPPGGGPAPTGRLRASGGGPQPIALRTGDFSGGGGVGRTTAAVARMAEPDPDPRAAGLAAAKAILGDNDPFVARPAIGAQGGRWTSTGLDQALSLDTPGVLDLPLQSWTDLGTRPGDTTLSVLTSAGLGLPAGDWFAPGDTIVVDPGGAYEQLLTLTAVDGHLLTVDQPLTHRSDDPVQVLYLPPRVTAPGGGTTPDPGTPSVPGTQPLPDATSSGIPKPTSSPASTSPTPTTPALPSVTPTTPDPDPTTSPVTTTPSAPPVIPVQPNSCPRLELTTSTTTMLPGQHGVAQVTGAAPNSLVELWAYSRPSTTPRIARMMLIDSQGNGTVDNLVPSTNTRLYAVQRGCALDGAGTTVLNLRTALSIDAERERKKLYRFSGRIIPGTLPTLVSLYRVQADGRQVLTAQTRSKTDGSWTLQRTFLGAGRFGFTARTGQTLTNAPGSSNVRSTVVH